MKIRDISSLIGGNILMLYIGRGEINEPLLERDLFDRYYPDHIWM